VQLPGREDRLHERPIDNLAELIEEAALSLKPYLRPPFAFFGHSMGSLIAFELCRKLRKLQWRGPECLFVSAMRGPHLPSHHAPLYNLPESALVEELRTLGGTPGGVFEDADLMELIMPTLRADLAICDQYEFLAERPLEVPICTFAGRDDPKAAPTMVDGWREQTLSRFSLHVMRGGHFFINTARQAVLDIIVSELSSFSTTRHARYRGRSEWNSN
jgi:medium-chain acyl-[acyl-carrier-protein] hydrolase